VSSEKSYYGIGLMSGSSLDGLDIVYCKIDWLNNEVVKWELLEAETVAFSDKWRDRLSGLPMQSALVFAKTDIYLGHYFASLIDRFIKRLNIGQIDFIASHGHTVFHDPDRRLTTQIGDGATIAALTQQRVISNFRAQDIALDGEGAPLAPLADVYLFKGYDYYLNLGGIANLSVQKGQDIIGFDVCPLNQVLNHYANLMGLPYDSEGQKARAGVISPYLMERLMAMDYFARPAPKSIGNEWIRNEVLPLYLEADLSPEDALATAVEHAALEISEAILALEDTMPEAASERSLFITGGGAFNSYLIERIEGYLCRKINCKINIPDEEIVSFKEALLMVLLGVLRLEGLPNCYPSMTRAKRPTVNGAVHEGRIKSN
jgi:anhydro-N-acetylmuramic acid kinase